MAVATIVLLLVGACATALVPSRYKYSGPFVTEEIEFKSDHTFVYHSRSDNGPSIWDATGSWQQKDRLGRVVETHVQQWHSTPANADPSPLRENEVWTLSSGIASRSNRIALQRSH